MLKFLKNRTITISQCTHEFIMMSKDFVQGIKHPESFEEAMQSSEKAQWIAAMKDELYSLAKNKTWTLQDLPKGSKALPAKWVYKVKTNADGSVDKFKARLVIKGFKQKYGIDYDQTFSPVAKMSTIRALISITATENLYLSQFDVSTAFLYGDLEETIYMNQPQGFEDGSKKICRLKKSLYGLKQAPRCWNSRIGNYLEKIGFKASTADACLYIREQNGQKLLLVLYVDDGLVASTDKQELGNFMKELQEEFKITIKDGSYFLGLEIETKDDYIKIHQEAYARKILERFNFSKCNPVSTPMEKLVANDFQSGKVTNFPYREAVGALMYLMLGTRPDISYSVGVLSRSLENPTLEDIQRVKRVFKYIAGTLQVGLTYYRKGPKLLSCFTDADFGGCQVTGRSTTGIIVTYGGCAISWQSQRQATVSTSTTEAEIIAASEGAKEIIWMKRLFKEIIKHKDIPIVHIDNTAAIRLAQNPEFHKRTKHISIRHFFIREKVIEGVLQIQQVSTENQVADLMTKPLCKPRLQYLRNLLNIN